MLGEGESRVTLERGGHLVNNEACPKLSQNFHKHNGANVLNAFGGILRDRDQPFPFPCCRNVSVLPDGGKTLIGLCHHRRFPVLNMLVLQAGWATGGVALFGLDESGEFVQGGGPTKKRL